MNLENLHLDELPFGAEIECNKPERDDLLYESLKQVAFLTKLILWIRCIYRSDFKDVNGQKIRKYGVCELTGNLRSHPDYQRYLSEKQLSEDPLDISGYIADLISIYRQLEIANGATSSE